MKKKKFYSACQVQTWVPRSVTWKHRFGETGWQIFAWIKFWKACCQFLSEQYTGMVLKCPVTKQQQKSTIIYLQIQSILKTPPNIFAFIPAGSTQCIGDPPWWDSDDSLANPTGFHMDCNKDTTEKLLHRKLTFTYLDNSSLSLTLEFATLSYREYQNNASCWSKCSIKLLFVYWKCRPYSLKQNNPHPTTKI